MTESEAARYAEDWIAAWNSHDLERILLHYSDDVELTSPLASRILGNGQDTVRGLRAAEVMQVDAQRRVSHVVAHYSSPAAAGSTRTSESP